MAGRINVAEQNLADGASAFLARIPGLKNRRQMFGFPRQRDGGTAAIDHDHRLAGGMERLHEFFLHFGQFNRITIEPFAFLRRSDAADINDQVRIRRIAEGFGVEFRQRTGRIVILAAPRSNPPVGFGGNRTSLCKSDFDVRPGHLLDAVQN